MDENNIGTVVTTPDGRKFMIVGTHRCKFGFMELSFRLEEVK